MSVYAQIEPLENRFCGRAEAIDRLGDRIGLVAASALPLKEREA
jgi:hypothetical protein